MFGEREMPRGIFDKETRRKAVAVAGAAMELGARTGLHGWGIEAGSSGLDCAATEIDHSGKSDFVHRMQAGTGHEFAASR